MRVRTETFLAAGIFFVPRFPADLTFFCLFFAYFSRDGGGNSAFCLISRELFGRCVQVNAFVGLITNFEQNRHFCGQSFCSGHFFFSPSCTSEDIALVRLKVQKLRLHHLTLPCNKDIFATQKIYISEACVRWVTLRYSVLTKHDIGGQGNVT